MMRRKNVVLLRLNAPAWAGEAVASDAAEQCMAGWTVEEVGGWLESEDMVGPAAAFRAQGVSGADLMAFESAEEVKRDLAMTMFVAKKVMRLRGARARA